MLLRILFHFLAMVVNVKTHQFVSIRGGFGDGIGGAWQNSSTIQKQSQETEI